MRGYEGIGRFILGLPREIYYINDTGLIQYLVNKMIAFPFLTQVVKNEN